MDTTLFDGEGRPAAYLIDDGEKIIYLWDGRAAAYLAGEDIYGWNGKHLGWFREGVLYNPDGYRVGSTREKCPSPTHDDPVKYRKLPLYAKAEKLASPAQPALNDAYSEENLEEFLKQGVIEST